MTSQRPLASALDKVFPHLLILLCGLGAAVIYDHHWPFRGHGDNPILEPGRLSPPRSMDPLAFSLRARRARLPVVLVGWG